MLGIIYTDDVCGAGIDILLALMDAGKIEKHRKLGSRYVVKFSDGWQWFISTTQSTAKYDMYIVDDGARLQTGLLKSLARLDKSIVAHINRKNVAL